MKNYIQITIAVLFGLAIGFTAGKKWEPPNQQDVYYIEAKYQTTPPEFRIAGPNPDGKTVPKWVNEAEFLRIYGIKKWEPPGTYLNP